VCIMCVQHIKRGKAGDSRHSKGAFRKSAALPSGFHRLDHQDLSLSFHYAKKAMKNRKLAQKIFVKIFIVRYLTNIMERV